MATGVVLISAYLAIGSGAMAALRKEKQFTGSFEILDRHVGRQAWARVASVKR
jgi:hypothetical protein